jgi:hypothetical protein
MPAPVSSRPSTCGVSPQYRFQVPQSASLTGKRRVVKQSPMTAIGPAAGVASISHEVRPTKVACWLPCCCTSRNRSKLYSRLCWRALRLAERAYHCVARPRAARHQPEQPCMHQPVASSRRRSLSSSGGGRATSAAARRAGRASSASPAWAAASSSLAPWWGGLLIHYPASQL